jgi:hypothetical protein
MMWPEPFTTPKSQPQTTIRYPKILKEMNCPPFFADRRVAIEAAQQEVRAKRIRPVLCSILSVPWIALKKLLVFEGLAV